MHALCYGCVASNLIVLIILNGFAHIYLIASTSITILLAMLSVCMCIDCGRMLVKHCSLTRGLRAASRSVLLSHAWRKTNKYIHVGRCSAGLAWWIEFQSSEWL